MISFSDTLYDVATECALKRRNKKCKNRFGSNACWNCRLNVANYIDADPRHVRLFMLKAEQRASNLRSMVNGYHKGFAIVIAIFLALAWVSWDAEQKRLSKPSLVQQVTTTVRQVVASYDITSDRQFMMALSLTADDLRRRVDVNGDGLVNCIDAAVRFYAHYPNKNNVRIVHNHNRRTGMNHLFNEVLLNGTWYAIEPQAIHTNNRDKIHMRLAWPGTYDASLNRIVTPDYIKFVKN